MSEEDKVLKRVKSDVRSVLISAPRGVLKRNFRKEFMSLVGQDVPFNKLGIRNMEDFVRSFPDVIRESIGPTGEPTYFVVANAETQHVASLVSRQKKPSLQRLRRAPRPSMKRSRPVYRPKQYTAPRTPRYRSHNLIGRNVSRSTAQYSNRSSYSPSVIPAGAEGMRNRSYSSSTGIPPWKEKYRNAVPFTNISSLIATKDKYNEKLVSVIGYPGNQDKVQQYRAEFRVLLFEDFSGGCLRSPVLNMFFTDQLWNEYPHPQTLPPRGGIKIWVWGYLVYKYWEKKGDYCHSLKPVYYETIGYCKPIPSNIAPLRITVSGKETYGRDVHLLEKTRSISTTSLSSKSSSSSGSDVPSGQVHSDVTLEDWLISLLRDKPNGLWLRVVLKQYKTFFNVDPPDNISQTIRNLSFIKHEEVVEGNPILIYVEDESPPLPDAVSLPSVPDEWVDIIIVSIVTPQDFHVQRFDNNKALQELTEKMNEHYEKHNKGSITSVNKDTLYAVCWYDSNEWCRAIVLNELENSLVLVKYPDYGNEEIINRSDLHVLPHPFYSLPFQGIRCSLCNVDENSDKAIEIFDELGFEKSFSALVTERSCDRYIVELLSCDSTSFREVSVSDLIKNSLYPVNTLTPVLPKVGSGRVSIVIVDVSICEPGYIYLHTVGLGTQKLAELSSDINNYYKKKTSARDMLTKNRLTVGMICCARYNDEWYRVKVMNISPGSSKVLVEYIDYGNTEDIEASRLKRPLTENPLFALPPQLIKCKLHDVPPSQDTWTDDVIVYLLYYTEYKEQLYLEMVSDNECLVFDEMGRNINEELLQDKSLFPDQVTTSTTNSHTPNKNNNSSESSVAPTPVNSPPYCTTPEECHNEVLPQGKEPIKVIVSHCISPGNFTIQLVSKQNDLESLQQQLQLYCANASCLSHYEKGMLGVAHYPDDGLWYRARLNNTFELKKIDGEYKQVIPCHFVDYGNDELVVDIVSITKQHLILPFQEIPAKLYGVCPINGSEWSDEACDIFCELATEQMYCILKGVESDTQQNIISLFSVNNNSIVSDLLIQKGVAKKT